MSGQQRAQILLNLFGLVWTAARANSAEPVWTCLDSSPHKAAGQLHARLPGKRTQGCRASARKADGQVRARLYAMVQKYAESMVKLDQLEIPQEEQQQQSKT
jgi:hypothetical protein